MTPLALTAITLGGFAGLAYLTKFSFLEELGKQYVLTAYAKGLTESRVLYGHVFRNAMLVVIEEGRTKAEDVEREVEDTKREVKKEKREQNARAKKS